MKKILIVVTVIIFIGLVIFWFFSIESEKISPETNNITTEDLKNEVLDSKDAENLRRDDIEGTEELKPIPKESFDEIILESIKIDVPFTSQAPYGVWDERHQEACEEASLLMVAKYLAGEKLNPEISERELQEMIDFQIEEYGDYKDSNMKEVVQLANDFYGIENLKVIYDFKKEKIKEELSKGNPIIIPTAGRLLENPYFTPPGPLYHNLVVVGYDGNNIITNDPGTKRGENYIYNIDILYNSIHDFTGKKENIEKGRKAMIVIND